MFNIFSKTPEAFGLDISSSSFKIVQLDRQGDRYGVKCFTEAPIPKGLVINDSISDVSTFSYLYKQNVAKPQFGRLTTNNAIVSLPESKSFVRVIQIPRMSESEAQSAVPFEAESFIPLPIDQVYLDWQKIGETEDKMNVLIVASPKEFVDKYLEVLEKAGITVLAIEVESQSCHRALIGKGRKDDTLIVDISASRTSLIMVEGGSLQFTSTIPIAGNTFTESIARTLGISSIKAEAIKMKIGIANTAEYPNIKTALLPVLNNLSAEIKNILKFNREHAGHNINKILLCGGGAKTKNLVDFLALELSDQPGIAVELGNSWQSVKMEDRVPLGVTDALNYTTTIGLALRGANYETH